MMIPALFQGLTTLSAMEFPQIANLSLEAQLEAVSLTLSLVPWEQGLDLPCSLDLPRAHLLSGN